MVSTADSAAGDAPAIAYRSRGRLYLNITSRCTLSCSFCPKNRHQWTLGGVNLYLPHEPTVSEVLTAVGDAARFDEVVFCGLGEPSLRLYDMLEIAGGLRERGARRVRVDTDGLANLVYHRDVTPDFACAAFGAVPTPLNRKPADFMQAGEFVCPQAQAAADAVTDPRPA